MHTTDGNLTHVTHPPAPNLKSSTIDGYFSQGFSINAVQFEGPVLVLPEMTLLWNVDDFDAITAESLVALEAIDPKTGQHDGWWWWCVCVCMCVYVCVCVGGGIDIYNWRGGRRASRRGGGGGGGRTRRSGLGTRLRARAQPPHHGR